MANKSRFVLPVALVLFAPAVAQATEVIPTFQSLGIYWTPPSDPGPDGCAVHFRKAGESAWHDGYPLWYDSRSIGGRDPECRGSLVNLTSGTKYEIELGMPGQAFTEKLSATTWNDAFPIGETVFVPDGNTKLVIDSGGTADAYKLYTFPAGATTSTIDVQDSADFDIEISAPYVIVRGLTLKGASSDAIRLQPGAHDIVIEKNDISGWGRYDHTSSVTGWEIGVNDDSAISAHCNSSYRMERLIVQRNKIHDPRYGSNSWAEGHPAGPQCIFFEDCGGNHVWRYNELWSSDGHYFQDPIGGGENFSDMGFPNSDSDIYGNIVKNGWDDAIESEGANRNVRIWGNYLDHTTTGVASSSTSVGPLYIFRNVYNRSRFSSEDPLDQDGRLYFGKAGSVSPWGGGRRYFFHNTLLQATPPAGTTYPLGAGSGISGNGTDRPIENTVTRNNIWHIFKDWWPSIDTNGGAGDSMDYDLYNGEINAYSGAEANGIHDTPVYAAGNGWSNEAGGMYQLDATSPGYDQGVAIPNFNDDFLGAAPDMGASEAGDSAMQFGVNAVGDSGGASPGTGGAGGSSGGSSNSGGSPGFGTGGTLAGAKGGHGAGSNASPGTTSDTADGGCGCRTTPSRSSSGLALFGLQWIVLMASRRRRIA